MDGPEAPNSPLTSISPRIGVDRAIFFIRLAVGAIFFSQGVLKFIDPNMGVNRFTRIGFAHPAFTAHFVGTFEMLCGALVLAGLATRLAAIPLLIIICTAIATTKIPELSHANQGFWFMVSDARADFSMLCSLLFLIVAGAGAWSVDRRLRLFPEGHGARDRGAHS